MIDFCKQYLDKTNSWGTDLETYLTKYTLIHICAECEYEIKAMIKKRASKCHDLELTSYVEERADIRDLRIHSIKGNILGKFSQKYSDIFIKQLDDKIISDYSNIIINRNLAAHGNDIHMSFSNVINAYSSVKTILNTLSGTIS